MISKSSKPERPVSSPEIWNKRHEVSLCGAEGIELSIKQFRADEQHKTNSGISADLDNALKDYTEGNFVRCSSILIKCFRIAEGRLLKEAYKIDRPSQEYDKGTVWNSNMEVYYLRAAIDTLHDASIVMLLANTSYSLDRDAFTVEHSLKTTKTYKIKEKVIKPNASISVLLDDLVDPLGEVLKTAKTTKEVAFILAQICLRKITASHLRRSESHRIDNQIAGMNCVMALANDDQDWISNYKLKSLQNARDLARGRAISGRFLGSNWIKQCVDDFESDLKAPPF